MFRMDIESKSRPERLCVRVLLLDPREKPLNEFLGPVSQCGFNAFECRLAGLSKSYDENLQQGGK
jgi:hypothetical protein